VVFTGGRSLHNHKRSRHSNIHCFPSSVDALHFRRARHDHPAQAHIAHPRLGYCGVIDERIDIELVRRIASARPGWQIVMVGPVAKIDPTLLPRLPNIHWLGQQGYDDLPAFISGWDVCLLPFALNESTRFISPTKTLEYMACGRPSVSTPIRDVVEPYGHVVAIHNDAEGFIGACENLLQRSLQEQEEHARTLAEIIARTSWDITAAAMGDLIAQAEAARESEELPTVVETDAMSASARTSAIAT
jgi:glycosyltransferase involved in cell wall biosynthesis